MDLLTLDHSPSSEVVVGELLFSVAVTAANVVRDIRENIKNLVGGHMVHYEKLIECTVERALAQLEQKARDKGYDGVLGIKVAHPNVVNGGVEIVVYGNGFNRNKS